MYCLKVYFEQCISTESVLHQICEFVPQKKKKVSLFKIERVNIILVTKNKYINPSKKIRYINQRLFLSRYINQS